MQQIAMGDHSREKLSSLAKRLETMDKKLDESAQQELIRSSGKSISQVANDLRTACKPENHKAEAQIKFNTPEPTEEQVKQVATEMKQKAVAPIENPKVRELLEEKKQKADQVIDDISIDTLVDAGYDEQATERAKEKIGNFKKFIEENKDSVDALQILYNQPYGKKGLTYKAIKDLAELIKKPPYLLDTHVLWTAYEQVEKDKVKKIDSPKNITNLVSLLRHTLGQQDVLEPFRVSVEQKYNQWLKEQGEDRFSPEQLEWLEMIKEHVASSVNIELSDLKLSPFDEKGGPMGAYRVFGNDLQKVIEELQGVLAA
jgi:type I restriction enzyme R subunit